MTRIYNKVKQNSLFAVSASSNMSDNTQPSAATPSPIPVRLRDSMSNDPNSSHQASSDVELEECSEASSPAVDTLRDSPSPTLPQTEESSKVPSLVGKARVRLHFEDVTHPAIVYFIKVMPVSTMLQTAISNVEKHLFTPPAEHNGSDTVTKTSPPETTVNPTAVFYNRNPTSLSRPPPPQHPIHPPEHWKSQEVRSVTLILRLFSGVAYTTGTDLDNAHKEIHLNIGYIGDIMKNYAEKTNPVEEFTHELKGSITHEMVHAFQHDACGTCPGGLIEGIADYVRLKSGLSARHWPKWPANKKNRGEKWDQGYDKTAWFLVWVEKRIGREFVGKLNSEMRNKKWEDGKLWIDIVGEKVDDLWKKYESSWDDMNRKHEKEKEKEEKETQETATKKGIQRPEGVWL